MAVASRPTSESSSRFSRSLNSLGLSEVTSEVRTSQLRCVWNERERKRLARAEFEASTFRHWYRGPLGASHPRTGRAQSEASGRWAKPQGNGLGTTSVKRRGERSFGTPARQSPWWWFRAWESAIASPWERRLARGALGLTRPHSEPRPEKGRANTAQHRARQRTPSRARLTQK